MNEESASTLGRNLTKMMSAGNAMARNKIALMLEPLLECALIMYVNAQKKNVDAIITNRDLNKGPEYVASVPPIRAINIEIP